MISKPLLYMKNKGTETRTNTWIVRESHLHAGSRRISNFSLSTYTEIWPLDGGR